MLTLIFEIKSFTLKLIFKQIKLYYQLTKSSIVYLVLVTTAFGYYLAGNDSISISHFFWTLFSAGLVCAGVCGLNQVIEWKDDLKMKRTQNRPIPSGAISPYSGFLFSFSITLIGLLLMFHFIGPLMALGGVVTGLLYLAVYTPLKKITWLNTIVGAVPGSLPPVGGWLARTGEINLETWLIFLLLFFWQHPHFYIIAWICKDDYKLGGFKMLPNVTSTGKKTFTQLLVYSFLMVITSFFLVELEKLGIIYLLGTVLLGAWFLWQAIKVFKNRTTDLSKHFLKVTVLYLPLLFLIALLDVWIN